MTHQIANYWPEYERAQMPGGVQVKACQGALGEALLDGYRNRCRARSASRLAPPAVAESQKVGSPSGILVADDDPTVRTVLKIFLRNKGCEVWLAGHGQEAVELYRRHRARIAVAFLDVQMPGMDGPHALIAMQRLDPNIRCCFMMGERAFYAKETLLLLGAMKIFQKPFSLMEVTNTLTHCAVFA
jgi:CheY-like chemotaxis protein